MASSEDRGFTGMIRDELGDEQFEAFMTLLKQRALDPEDYYLLPVHPWQWYNKLAHVFAADIATEKLVYLGEGPLPCPTIHPHVL